jgi:hypothetical protein
MVTFPFSVRKDFIAMHHVCNKTGPRNTKEVATMLIKFKEPGLASQLKAVQFLYDILCHPKTQP